MRAESRYDEALPEMGIKCCAIDLVGSITNTDGKDSMERERARVRVVYGVQSVGRGHLTRFLALKPLFDRDGHEMLVILSGQHDPPPPVREAIGGSRYEQLAGITMVEDGVGGISKRKTVQSFATGLPDLFVSLRHAHRLISDFDPDLIVSDFDVLTASPFVAPHVYKVGIGNQAMLHHPGVTHLSGHRMDRFNIGLAMKLCTGGLDTLLGSHFYPIDEQCLPPILRSEILSTSPTDDGHIVVYHSFPGRLEPIARYAGEHSERRIMVYGYSAQPVGMPRNMRFETDVSRFAEDLASCSAYVGTAGFQAICEAFYLGKRILLQPIEGQYEQRWNGAQLAEYGMGRVLETDLESALDYPFPRELHQRLLPWYEHGAQTCYERITSYAEAADVRDA